MIISLTILFIFYFIITLIEGVFSKLSPLSFKFKTYEFGIYFSIIVYFILFIFLLSSLPSNTYLLNSFLTQSDLDTLITLPSEFSYVIWPFMYIFLVVTLLSVLFCFTFNTTQVNHFKLFISLITLFGSLFFFTNSLFFFFLYYESLLIPSFLILYNFSKTRKSVEAAFLMFFWTQFGAMFLIFLFQYLIIVSGSHFFSGLTYVSWTNSEIVAILIMLVVGFGVKFPIWPFYDWLPKAHVEASTNFSIFLSGVLVKFAFFGFMKLFIFISAELSFWFLEVFLLFGIVEVTFKLYYQYDLKKLVAYATVLEMHWLTLAVISGHTLMFVSAFAMFISHALLSSSFFMSVDFITRRFKTRLITEISSIFYLLPNLYTFCILLLITFLGFPGSLFFVAEFLFFSTLIDMSFLLAFVLFFFIYLLAPVCFFKNWFFSLFNYNFFFNEKNLLGDLNIVEFLLLSFFLINIYVLGVAFQYFI